MTQHVYRVIFHASTEFTEPQIQQAIRDHYEKYLRFLTKITRRAQEAGEIRDDVDAELLAWQIVHAAVGFAMVKPLGIRSHGTPEFVEQTVRLILELLAPRKAAQAGG